MGGSHHAERITKSEGVKVVKMNFSEDDLYKSRISRLTEIKKQIEKTIPENTVFLSDLVDLAGVSETTKISGRARKLNIEIYSKRRGGQHNKPGLCVTESDAEKILRSFYEN